MLISSDELSAFFLMRVLHKNGIKFAIADSNKYQILECYELFSEN